MRILYDLAFWVYGLLAFPAFVAKGKHQQGWRERWGHVPQYVLAAAHGKPVVWVHAVSVGETRLACRLIAELKKHDPSLHAVLTTMTAGGKQVAADALGRDAVVFAPFDWSVAVGRFFAALRPSVAIVLETDLWPNLYAETKRRGIPLVLVNARISDRAFGAYRAAAGIFKKILEPVDACLAQSELDAERFAAIGMSRDKIRVTGNMKYDFESPVLRAEVRNVMDKIRPGRFVFVAGSTHAGEEEAVAEATARASIAHPELRVVLAPRHVERVAEAEKALKEKGLASRLWSEIAAGKTAESGDVVVLDRWGILREIYAASDAVFVGGSIAPIGGHNLAEAAICAKPVLHGPYLQNFKEMAEEFRAADASRIVENASELESEMVKLMENEREREALSQRAKALVQKHAGATARNREEIMRWFKNT